MKYAEVAKMGADALMKKEVELNVELMKLRAQASTGTPPKNASQIRTIKKELARINHARAQKGGAVQNS
jgi:ribosomal protein L29